MKNPLVVLPTGSDESLASLASALAQRIDAAVVTIDMMTGLAVSSRPRRARELGRGAYDTVSRWPIDDRWLDAVVRYAAHHCPSPPTLDELWDYVPLTEALGGQGLLGAEAIVAVDEALVPVMLSVSGPYTAVVSKLPVETPEGPLPGPLALALHAAPIIAATNLETWFGLTNRGYASVYYCPLVSEPAQTAGDERRDGDPFTVLIPQRLTVAGEAAAAPAAVESQTGAEDPMGDVDRVLALSAVLLGPSEARPGVVAVPGAVDERLSRAADRAGVGASLQWLGEEGPGLDERYSSADVILVAPCDVYELERSVVRAAAYGKPIAAVADLSFLNSIHQSPVPALAVNGADSVDAEALATARREAAEWFQAERSLEAMVSRLEGLIRSVGSDAYKSASFYSLRQKRWELFYESGAAAHYDEKYHLGLCYQRMDERLARIVASSIAKGIAQPRILDLGCGPGSLVPYLQRIEGAEIVGIDLSPEMIFEARSRYPEVDFSVGDCEAIDVPDQSFDAVLCSGVLHHLPSLAATFSEVRRVLRPGGVFILREPTDDHFAHRHPRHAFIHLCLRHHLHVAMGRRIVEEPEPHADHRELQAQTLVRELEPFLSVERVSTDLRVAYFYDMIEDPELFATVEELEATLSSQPGLNLLMVSRRSDAPAAKAVQKSLAALTDHRPIGVEHLSRLSEAIGRFEAFAPLSLPGESDLATGGWRALVPPGPNRVLALSDQPGRVAELCASLHDEAMVSWLPLSEAVSGRHGGYDFVLVEVVRQAEEHELEAAIQACRPYGRCYFELGTEAEVLGRAAGLAKIPVVAVSRRPRHPADWRLRFLVVPMAYTALDARYALRSLLADLEGADPQVKLLRKHTDAEIQRLERASYFGALRAVETDRTIRMVLDIW